MKAAALLIAGLIAFSAPAARSQVSRLPETLTDPEFWRLVTELSEAGGNFQRQLMTNEDSLQFVIPELKRAGANSVYIGVGPEQNFTYIAAIRPRMAFVLDIRRDNMLEHLMYKALFEMSKDRVDFVSRLFSRKQPEGLNPSAGVKAMFDALAPVESDPKMSEETAREVLANLTTRHRFELTERDRSQIASFLEAFRTAGPGALVGSGDKGMTYAQSMAGTDLAGRSHGYLASEENFKLVQEMERRNLIVPLVGDFGGEKTIASIGRYAREHGAVVEAFYVSNVERYLWDQGGPSKQFYANVESLPLNGSSIFIRSVTADISRRLGIAISDRPENWRTYLSPIGEFLKNYNAGAVAGYRDLFR